MKKINTLLLVVGCLSASLVTGCYSSNSTRGPVNNNQSTGDTSNPPTNPMKPGTPGKSVCFVKSCAPVTAKSKIVDPRGDYKYLDSSRFPTASQRPFYRAPIAFLDLSTLSPETRLTANYSLKDFASASKGRYAVLSPNVVRRIQNIRDRLGAGLRVTSGYRSPGYNRRIDKSASWSRHMYGDGIDLAGKPMRSIRDACTANNATFFLLYKDGHVHCDWRAIPLDPVFYPPTTTMTANQLLVQNEIALSRSTKILFTQTDEGVRFTVELPDIELEGVPEYEWVVTSPSGKETRFDSEAPLLAEADEKGTYFVKVIIGDFIESETQVDLL